MVGEIGWQTDTNLYYSPSYFKNLYIIPLPKQKTKTKTNQAEKLKTALLCVKTQICVKPHKNESH